MSWRTFHQWEEVCCSHLVLHWWRNVGLSSHSEPECNTVTHWSPDNTKNESNLITAAETREINLVPSKRTVIADSPMSGVPVWDRITPRQMEAQSCYRELHAWLISFLSFPFCKAVATQTKREQQRLLMCDPEDHRWRCGIESNFSEDPIIWAHARPPPHLPLFHTRGTCI